MGAAYRRKVSTGVSLGQDQAMSGSSLPNPDPIRGPCPSSSCTESLGRLTERKHSGSRAHGWGHLEDMGRTPWCTLDEGAAEDRDGPKALFTS